MYLGRRGSGVGHSDIRAVWSVDSELRDVGLRCSSITGSTLLNGRKSTRRASACARRDVSIRTTDNGTVPRQKKKYWVSYRVSVARGEMTHLSSSLVALSPVKFMTRSSATWGLLVAACKESMNIRRSGTISFRK